MSEERFWNTDEYASTAKFAVLDGAMTMRHRQGASSVLRPCAAQDRGHQRLHHFRYP